MIFKIFKKYRRKNSQGGNLKEELKKNYQEIFSAKSSHRSANFSKGKITINIF